MLKNKKITVVGSGISGIVATKLLLRHGISVTLYDGNEAVDVKNIWDRIGTEIPVVTLPVAIVNDGLNKTWLYPKTKITSSLAYEDGLWVIHCACIAENLDTAGLKTGMLIEAAVSYE